MEGLFFTARHSPADCGPPEALPLCFACSKRFVLQAQRSASLGTSRAVFTAPKSEALPPSPARTNPSPEPLNRSAWFSGQRGALPFPAVLQAEALRSGKTRKGEALGCQQVGAVLSSQKREALLFREALNNEALPAWAGVAIPNGEALRLAIEEEAPPFLAALRAEALRLAAKGGSASFPSRSASVQCLNP